MDTHAAGCGSPLSILLIDDSMSERALLQFRLQQMGHRVTDETNGGDALRTLYEAMPDFDLILLDVGMPHMDGLETCRRIRAIEIELGEEWRPIIFLSGRNGADDIAAGIAAGGDDYLVKPVDNRILKAKIQAMQRIADMRKRLVETLKQLQRQAHTDELTGLVNRRRFMDVLDQELARAKRQGTDLSLAYLDLDHFKRINDDHGHEAGDDVLRTVASSLSGIQRAEDTMGRLGGEEFCICMPGTDIEDSLRPCERYRELIAALEVKSGPLRLHVTASLGVTAFEPLADDRATLLARADKALYRAKQGGRNRVEVLPSVAGGLNLFPSAVSRPV
jgi:two-component system cell cycle response regulator